MELSQKQFRLLKGRTFLHEQKQLSLTTSFSAPPCR
jgi:hypothetical protein